MIVEAGSPAGKHEIHNTSIEQAYEYVRKVFQKQGNDIDVILPNFKRNYEVVRTMISGGHTKRKDMPVISSADLHRLQKMLQSKGITVKSKTLKARDLVPIQQQVYLDKTMYVLGKYGAKESEKFIKSKRFIITEDNHILDGHHRYLSAMVNNPNMVVKALQIHHPLSEILPMLTDFSDSIGNKRNL